MRSRTGPTYSAPLPLLRSPATTRNPGSLPTRCDRHRQPSRHDKCRRPVMGGCSTSLVGGTTQTRRRNTRPQPGAGSRLHRSDLLYRARQEDARHREQRRRPISAEMLRTRLQVGRRRPGNSSPRSAGSARSASSLPHRAQPVSGLQVRDSSSARRPGASSAGGVCHDRVAFNGRGPPRRAARGGGAGRTGLYRVVVP